MSSIPRRAAIAQLRSTSDKYSNLLDVAKCARWAKEAGASMLFLPECFGYMGESSEATVSNAAPPVRLDDDLIPSGRDEIWDALASTVSRHDVVGRGGTAMMENTRNESSSIGSADNSEDVGTDFSVLDGLRAIARESGLWISGGGLHESGAPPSPTSSPPPHPDDANGPAPPRPRVYNTHVVIDGSGSVKCLYRKVHLFDVSIPNKVNLRESATTAAGRKLVVCDSPIGRLGLSTCYDVRFPEMYVDLVQQGGAEILLVPSAFTVPTGRAHWHALLRARAIENQCYVIAAAQYGKHNEKRSSYGHSLAVDPWGDIVADAGGSDGPGTVKTTEDGSGHDAPSIITCDIDLKKLKSIRERMPIQRHRDSCEFSF